MRGAHREYSGIQQAFFPHVSYIVKRSSYQREIRRCKNYKTQKKRRSESTSLASKLKRASTYSVATLKEQHCLQMQLRKVAFRPRGDFPSRDTIQITKYMFTFHSGTTSPRPSLFSIKGSRGKPTQPESSVTSHIACESRFHSRFGRDGLFSTHYLSHIFGCRSQRCAQLSTSAPARKVLHQFARRFTWMDSNR